MSPVSPVFHTEETVIIAFKCFIIRGVNEGFGVRGFFPSGYLPATNCG